MLKDISRAVVANKNQNAINLCELASVTGRRENLQGFKLKILFYVRNLSSFKSSAHELIGKVVNSFPLMFLKADNDYGDEIELTEGEEGKEDFTGGAFLPVFHNFQRQMNFT